MNRIQPLTGISSMQQAYRYQRIRFAQEDPTPTSRDEDYATLGEGRPGVGQLFKGLPNLPKFVHEMARWMKVPVSRIKIDGPVIKLMLQDKDWQELSRASTDVLPFTDLHLVVPFPSAQAFEQFDPQTVANRIGISPQRVSVKDMLNFTPEIILKDDLSGVYPKLELNRQTERLLRRKAPWFDLVRDYITPQGSALTLIRVSKDNSQQVRRKAG